jgi:hypothetical protein
VVRARVAALLLILALAAATASACESRSQDAPRAGEPAARMLVTADHGARSLLDGGVPPDQSVMAALRGATEVRTEYGGGFVAEMFDLTSDAGAQRDWFLFVNGLLSPVGARDATLAAGDLAWWDFREWGALSDPWAVVGAWPQPFTGTAPAVFADAPLAAALAGTGATLTDDPASPWRVRVGASAAIAAGDPAWARALDDPAGAGLTIWIDGADIVALDAASGQAAPVAGARAAIVAVPTGAFPEEGVLVAVAGLDEDAARAAAAALADDPGLVRGAYAVALDGDGRVLRAGGRAGGG